jgi:hypothetical protein
VHDLINVFERNAGAVLDVKCVQMRQLDKTSQWRAREQRACDAETLNPAAVAEECE